MEDIVLGAKVPLSDAFAGNAEDTFELAQNTLSIIADTVTQQNLSEDLFSIPKDYKDYSYQEKYKAEKDSIDRIMEIQKEMIESEIKDRNPKNEPKKSPAKNKSAPKQSALRRKDS